jgi:hypothetical protein
MDALMRLHATTTLSQQCCQVKQAVLHESIKQVLLNMEAPHLPTQRGKYLWAAQP